MKLPNIIGISGTNGAGKDTLGELLAELHSYKFISASDIIRAELTQRGLSHERENMRALSTEWAKQFGHSAVVIKAIEAYELERVERSYHGLAIGSIRRPAEAKEIQAAGGAVLWVDADKRTRYERIQAGNRARVTDSIPFKQWVAEEEIEMTPPVGDDGSALNMAGVRDIADIHVDNNFESQQVYREYLIKEFEL